MSKYAENSPKQLQPSKYSITVFSEIKQFLSQTQNLLEKNECANSLLLGICLRIQSGDATLVDPPLLLTVEEKNQIALVAVMTPPFNLIIAHLDDQNLDAVTAIAQHLKQSEWKVPGVLGPVTSAERFARDYASDSGTAYTLLVEERIHALQDVNHPEVKSGMLRSITVSDHALIHRWALDFHNEATPDDPSSGLTKAVNKGLEDKAFFILEDAYGTPVSMVRKTRPTRNTISINFVYTPKEFRGNGYASQAVAELSQILLDEGYTYCTLFTDLANPTSNSIYQKIGYRPVLDVNLYKFDA